MLDQNKVIDYLRAWAKGSLAAPAFDCSELSNQLVAQAGVIGGEADQRFEDVGLVDPSPQLPARSEC